MTQDELKTLIEDLRLNHEFCPKEVILQAADELERLAQPEQGPVAWRTFNGEGGYDYCSHEDNESYADDWNKRNPNHVEWVDKLYTHSQRTWVDLTRTQMQDVYFEVLKEHRGGHQMQGQLAFGEALQAKIKERNS